MGRISGPAVLAVVAVTVAAGGCARVPTSPYVMALPGPGRTLEQFEVDDGACRGWAVERDRQAAGAGGGASGSGMRQQAYDMAYLQCMYAKGNRIPGAGAPSSPAGPEQQAPARVP